MCFNALPSLKYSGGSEMSYLSRRYFFEGNLYFFCPGVLSMVIKFFKTLITCPTFHADFLFSHISVPHLVLGFFFFTVRVIKSKLLRVFLEQCRTKAPSTSLSPTCWLAFSTPVRTSEQRASHSSGEKHTQMDS